MGPDRIVGWLASLNFRQAVWLFPIAYTLHVLEELPQFTNWARRYASAGFTMRDYLAIHLSGIVVAFIASLVIRWFPNRAVIFVFFTLIFTPAVCFNILFHAGATAAFGAYCPGLLTALTLYPPLFYVISRRAFREGLLTNRVAVVSFALAGLFHAADVSHNVFKVW
ncbi:MAG TPA: HXXEE domain-containing protein [Pyrinomonadaceae bacterium]|nr:HXXEE domain-containing protein [Pyrinomonadaceae bacterium]